MLAPVVVELWVGDCFILCLRWLIKNRTKKNKQQSRKPDNFFLDREFLAQFIFSLVLVARLQVEDKDKTLLLHLEKDTIR